jgi:uncharacterized membrane protein
MKVLSLLPLVDWLALAAFFALWIGYAWFARVWGQRQSSLLSTTNRYRGHWMRQATARDPRMLDGLITQTLSNTPAFFSSTSILVIGGLFALLGTTDKATELMSGIPFAQATTLIVFEFKVLVLVAIFVYAFFRFSWCMRQYTFVALVIGSMPPPADFDSGQHDREKFADLQSGRMFVHLRLHTEFSVVDGTNRIDDRGGRAAADGQPALAITDLNNLFGAIKFYKATRVARASSR